MSILTVMTGEKRRWKCACGGRAVSVKILRNQALKEKHMRNKEERRKRK
ncbi:hypothetical protein [Roseburia amylophila]